MEVVPRYLIVDYGCMECGPSDVDIIGSADSIEEANVIFEKQKSFAHGVGLNILDLATSETVR